MTQEEIDARIAASNAKKGPKAEAINNSEIVEAFRKKGGRVLHLPPNNLRQRGGTIAYRLRGSRVEIATALTHPNDTFARKFGTKTAIEHFEEGRTVFIPVQKAFGNRYRDVVYALKNF